MPNDEDIRDHLEATLGLSLKADYSLLAYIIEMAFLEFASTEVHEAVASTLLRGSPRV